LLHELPEFELFTPSTLEEAVEILHEGRGSAKILAGGTDLLGLMKDRIEGPLMPIPEALVDVKKIKELRSISHTNSDSLVGAAMTLSEITAEGVLSERFPAFVQAAGVVGTNQIRNMGTLGGNLCQRPWCWYFRHPAYDCFKKGGRQCFAITGDNSTYFSVYDLGICVMAHPSDTAPALISLDASAEIAGPRGVRRVPMHDFFLSPREPRDHVVDDDEVLVRVRIPKTLKRSVYIKQRVRNNWDFALASAAASALVKDGLLSSVTVVLGGVAPRPQTIEGVDDILADGLTEVTKAKVRALLSENARPLRLNRYKLRILNALVVRALESLSRL
jgi:xanthine dehydrogenase YagS FAD-binding subunit